MRAIAAAAGLLVLAGCGGHEVSAAPAPATVTVTATPAAAAAPGLRAAVYAYSAAYLEGRGAAAYGMLSKRCKARISRGDFVMTVNLAKWAADRPMRITSYRDRIAGGLARVTYTFPVAAINQTDEPWVFEGGRWREDDC